MSQKIGLVAGYGQFPILWAQRAKNAGHRVYAIGIKEETSPELQQYVYKMIWLSVSQLKRALLFFALRRVKNLVLAGKIHKTRIYGQEREEIDGELRDVFKKAPDRRDDSLLKAVVHKIEQWGFHVLDSTTYMEEDLADSGVQGALQPSDQQWEDIRFGQKMASAIGGLDIGQSVIVKEQAVLAVEAIEGTDEAIRRGAKLGGQGAVLVKVSKPDQDMRFDVPVIGKNTIDVLKESACSVLAVEAGKTLFLNKTQVLECADQAGIVVVGI